MAKAFSQACENNKQPILDVLARHLSDCSKLLEIGSGTGQHAAFFAEKLPHLYWQTSDLIGNHKSIQAWIEDASLENIGQPVELDVDSRPWPVEGFDAVFSANTCHIMAWGSVINLFAGLGESLMPGGKCCIYGPFNYQGQFTSESNARFDIWLKQQQPHQGIRDFEDIASLASRANLHLLEDNAMPANNRLLVWQKGAP